MMNDKGRYRQCRARQRASWLGGLVCDRNSEAIINRVLQLLGHPVNDLFDLKANTQQQEIEVDSVTAQAAPSVETASGQGIDHGGSDHEQPVCDLMPVPQPEQTELVEIRKGHRPHRLHAALKRELHEVIQGAKRMVHRINQLADLWELEHYLTQRRKETDRKYDYRYSQLRHVLGRVLHEGRVHEEESIAAWVRIN